MNRKKTKKPQKTSQFDKAQSEAQTSSPASDTNEMDDSTTPPAVETSNDTYRNHGSGVVDDAEARLADAENKVADYLDKLTRSQAELQNVRKRAEREISQVRKYANERFATELLAIKDSLELSLQKDSKTDSKKLHEGVELTLKLLEQTFKNFGIIEINPQGETFDPDYHQAMMVQADDKHPPNTVIQVMQKGYRLDNRLLRAAMVCVSGTSSATPPNSSTLPDDKPEKE